MALFAPAAAADPAPRDDFRQALDRVMAAPDGPPGLSVLIRKPGRSLYFRRGTGDLRSGAVPNRTQHVRIASIAKAFSGAVVMKLADRGRLSLDDTIGEHLPRALPRARKVTLRQVLTHTSGLPDYIRDDRFIERLSTDPERGMAPRRLLTYVEDAPLEFRPGTRYEYSDTDNIVAGLIAEKVAGKRYELLLRRLVYRPLGLEATSLPRTVEMPRPYLHGYDVSPEEPAEDVSELINPALAWASGGIVSSARDLGRFIRGYAGHRLLSREARRDQRRWVAGSSSPPGPGINRAGAGLFRYATRCGKVYGHTGSFPGYRVFAASTAGGRRSVVFFVNAQIVPGQGSQRVSDLIRRAQARAVCLTLR